MIIKKIFKNFKKLKITLFIFEIVFLLDKYFLIIKTSIFDTSK